MLSVEKTTPKSVKLFITCQYLLSFPATMWHLCSSESKMGHAFYLWVLVDLSFVSLSSLVGKFFTLYLERWFVWLLIILCYQIWFYSLVCFLIYFFHYSP